MVTTTPAVLLVHGDGTIVGDNPVARRLLGDAMGRRCWDFMGALPDARGLPCEDGCVAALLVSEHRANRTRVSIDGEVFELTCIATAEERVACTLHPIEREAARLHQLLTRRERDVLERIAAGDTTHEIADELAISAATVRSYVEQMRNKLGVSSRAALVAQALRLGLIL